MWFHDRSQNDDSIRLGTLQNQLRLAHVLGDLAGAAELYPERVWSTQLADELRIPPTSNQAELDLRPTATKHAVNPLTVLRDAFTGTLRLPPAAAAPT